MVIILLLRGVNQHKELVKIVKKIFKKLEDVRRKETLPKTFKVIT
jgi:hypothetical protein